MGVLLLELPLRTRARHSARAHCPIGSLALIQPGDVVTASEFTYL